MIEIVGKKEKKREKRGVTQDRKGGRWEVKRGGKEREGKKRGNSVG